MKAGRPKKCDQKLEEMRGNIRRGEIEILKETILEFGIDAKDGDDRTALINSVIENKVDIINWLVDNGANVNSQDKLGYTVLHYVGQEKLTELGKYFLDNGADINIQDIYGNPPLWTAIFNSRSDFDVVKLFLKKGANINIENQSKRTPKILYETIYKNDLEKLIR
ncbi:ankyrin repeat domain-containing protein [uncultured Flavobacterium sp.]|uniref:ankyrin repeat domain-containing protein n=1 Tax=uncultured Flavobacterium sp. TaxID=165435 RepID=UPI0025F16B8A|nr:ankyrin repeat domain-containing protein [uncultured Flavobacterium sp.]